MARLSRLALTNMGSAVSLYVKSGIASGTAAPVPCHLWDFQPNKIGTPKNGRFGGGFGCHLFSGTSQSLSRYSYYQLLQKHGLFAIICMPLLPLVQGTCHIEEFRMLSHSSTMFLRSSGNQSLAKS